MLRLSPDLCNELDRLKLRFSEGSLVVSDEHANSATLHTELHMVLLQVYRVSEWSDSRWLGISRSAKKWWLLCSAVCETSFPMLSLGGTAHGTSEASTSLTEQCRSFSLLLP